MAVVDEFSKESYDNLVDKDNITKTWFLTGSPIPVLSILALYLWFVLSLGPRLMVSRQPYQIKSIMRLYNVIQVLHNGYILCNVFIYKDLIWFMIINDSCYITDFNKYERERYLLLIHGWNYLFSKIFDLMDTVFMVLRKKNISFLHIYHHTTMVFSLWISLAYIGIKFYQGAPVGAMNVFVHFVMYSYFFLATFPQLKPYLWWKKHLTKLQMVQFVVALAYLSLLYYFDCPVPPAINYLWMANIFVILLLFVNFYFRTYVISPSSDKAEGKAL